MSSVSNTENRQAATLDYVSAETTHSTPCAAGSAQPSRDVLVMMLFESVLRNAALNSRSTGRLSAVILRRPIHPPGLVLGVQSYVHLDHTVAANPVLG